MQRRQDRTSESFEVLTCIGKRIGEYSFSGDLKMDLRKKRDEETFFAGTCIVVLAVLFMSFTMISLAVEIVFLPENPSWRIGRILAMRMGAWEVDSYLMLVLGLLITFGAGLVAKRLDKAWAWRIIVYSSMLGLAASLLSVLMVGGDAAEYLNAYQGELGVVPALDQNSGVTEAANRVASIAVAAAIWFIGQIALQFDLKLPTRTGSGEGT